MQKMKTVRAADRKIGIATQAIVSPLRRSDGKRHIFFRKARDNGGAPIDTRADKKTAAERKVRKFRKQIDQSSKTESVPLGRRLIA